MSVVLDGLHELDRRRPDFIAGGPRVLLRDGERWTLGLPRVVVVSRRTSRGTVLVPEFRYGGVTDTGRYDALFMEFVEAYTAGKHLDRDELHRGPVYGMAALSLTRNYELEVDEARALLLPGPHDDPVARAALQLDVLRAAVDLPLRRMRDAIRRMRYRIDDDPEHLRADDVHPN